MNQLVPTSDSIIRMQGRKRKRSKGWRSQIRNLSRISLPLFWTAALTFFLLTVDSNISTGQQSAVPASALLDKAESLLKEGKPEEALSQLIALENKDPKTPRLEADLGQAYFQSRQFPQAVQHLKIALEENASDFHSTQMLAMSFYLLGNCHDALPLLERAGAETPKNIPDAAYLISICQVMTDQLDKARASLARSFSVSPDSAMAYLALAKLLVRQHMIEKAVPPIETALEKNPRLPMAHFLLGEIELSRSDPQAAAAEFQRELAVNPTLWLVYWRLGDSYFRLARYDEAEKALKEAIWLNDGSADAIALLGEIALKRNDPALASGFFERAISIDPQNLAAHEFLAQAYKILGRESEANEQAEIARKLRRQRQATEKEMPQLLP